MIGFDLDQIREMLRSEDRLTEMRAEAPQGISPQRRAELVAEAIAIDIKNRLRLRVDEKPHALNGFLAELDANELQYRAIGSAETAGDPAGSR